MTVDLIIWDLWEAGFDVETYGADSLIVSMRRNISTMEVRMALPTEEGMTFRKVGNSVVIEL